jgi:uncharacterized protein (DUF2384 family)
MRYAVKKTVYPDGTTVWTDPAPAHPAARPYRRRRRGLVEVLTLYDTRAAALAALEVLTAAPPPAAARSVLIGAINAALVSKKRLAAALGMSAASLAARLSGQTRTSPEEAARAAALARRITAALAGE